jgi:hypothetical protein
MASRTEVGDTRLWNNVYARKKREAVTIFIGNIADNFPITADMTPIIVLGASAARDILMPANSIDIDGLCITIQSNSTTTTGVLTLKTSADAALSPAVTIAQSAGVSMIYLHGIGWRKKGAG